VIEIENVSLTTEQQLAANSTRNKTRKKLRK
jgi:hypothetical protein